MRRLIHRGAWFLGACFLVIALAGDDPRSKVPSPIRDEGESPSSSESETASDDPFRPYVGYFLPDKPEQEDEESDTSLELPEPNEGLVESGTMAPALLRKIEARMAEAEKGFQPISFTIPDDPPPHEGKMIDFPVIIDSPDLIQVEVLEALPGRPISGERLVRPDGTISLDFYGDVHVRGLTREQAKTRIILHLRRFLTDEVLGLIEEDIDYEEAASPLPEAPTPPSRINPLPPTGEPLFPHLEEDGKLDLETLTPEQLKAIRELLRTREQKRTRPSRSSSRTPRRTIRRIAHQTPAEPRPAPVIVVPTEKGNIRVTIEVEGNLPDARPSAGPVSPPPASVEDQWNEGPVRILHPSQSDRVFVDVTAYNHDVYFVQGDVVSSGRLPSTGNETVLDALNYAGGLASTADPANIRLVRPARGGRPAKIYHINYNAIVNEGDPKSNLQVFPGDRLVVGRHPTVQSTVALDRAAAILNSATNTMLTSAYMAKNLRNATQDSQLTPIQIRERVNAWVDLMWPLVEKGDAGVVDEKTFRDALLKSVLPNGKPQPEAPK